MERKPLPISLPSEYAKLLEGSKSQLSHINAGRRHRSIPDGIKVMDQTLTDECIADLQFSDLHPELKPALKYLSPKKKTQTRKPRHGQQ